MTHTFLRLLVAIGISEFAGIIGSFFTVSAIPAWYSTLTKPTVNPPPWVFGPVWTILYLLIAIGFGKVFWMAFQRQLPWKIALPFLLNLIFNFAFTPLQFGLQSNLLASVDVLLVLVTLVWALATIWNRKRWIAYLQIPYFLWVSFATVLQLSITWLNRGA